MQTLVTLAVRMWCVQPLGVARGGLERDDRSPRGRGCHGMMLDDVSAQLERALRKMEQKQIQSFEAW